MINFTSVDMRGNSAYFVSWYVYMHKYRETVMTCLVKNGASDLRLNGREFDPWLPTIGRLVLDWDG